MIVYLSYVISCAILTNTYAIGHGFARFHPQRLNNPTHVDRPENMQESINKQNQPLSYYPKGEVSYAYWNCHEIPPNMTLCKSVGYSQMVLPNFLQHESIREVIQQANVWVALVNTDCHPDIQRFLCSLYAPVCLKSHQEAKIPPCWELCDQVRNACLPRMRLFGFDWPDIVQCGQFPKLAESMCIASQETTAVKCAPCEQTVTLENIASSYCMADVVLKASLKAMTLDSTNSFLRLIPNSRTKALKLLRQDGTTSTSSGFNRLRRRSRLQRLNYRNLRSRYYRHVPSSQTRPTEPRDLLMSKLPYLDNWHIRTRRSLPHWTQTLNQSVNPSSGKRRPHNRSKNNRPRRKRRPRNSKLHDLDGIVELRLSCSTCSGLTVSNADMENKYWLIMGRRIVDEKTGNLSNRVQVTFLATWDRGSAEFKRSLTAIRTQPVASLCPKKQSVIASTIPDSNGSLSPNRNLKISRSTHSELSDAPTSNAATRSPVELRETSGSSTKRTNTDIQHPTPSNPQRNRGYEDRGESRNPIHPIQRYRHTYRNQPVQVYNRWRMTKPIQPNKYSQSSPSWYTTLEARRRQRRRERRLWQQRQQQKPMKNQLTSLTDSTLRQTPINPYSNEPSSYYSTDVGWM